MDRFPSMAAWLAMIGCVGDPADQHDGAEAACAETVDEDLNLACGRSLHSDTLGSMVTDILSVASSDVAGSGGGAKVSEFFGLRVLQAECDADGKVVDEGSVGAQVIVNQAGDVLSCDLSECHSWGRVVDEVPITEWILDSSDVIGILNDRSLPAFCSVGTPAWHFNVYGEMSPVPDVTPAGRGVFELGPWKSSTFPDPASRFVDGVTGEVWRIE